jgi:hypothetical protein
MLDGDTLYAICPTCLVRRIAPSDGEPGGRGLLFAVADADAHEP